MFEIVIKDGWIIDGTGNPWFRADVGIQAGRITALRPFLDTPASLVINAANRIVCPGFIDMHGHSNWWLLVQPHHAPKVMQGVTTELLGQDGFSLAPIKEGQALVLRRLIAGMDGDPPVPVTWASFAEYMQAIQRARPSVNFAGLVGHGTVRMAAMGMENRTPDRHEMASMKTMVAQAMQEGAAGMSTGLLYAPCYFAETLELIQLAKVVAEYAGILVVHLRSEGHRLLDAIDEMLEVSRSSRVSLHISHLKVFGRRNWGRSGLALDKLTAAREEGIDVTFDQYPYTAGSTGLIAVLPRWATEGGPDRILERLRSAEDRRRIVLEITTDAGWENFILGAGAENMVISWVGSERNKWMEGKTIAENAERLKREVVDYVLDLLAEECLDVSMINFSLSEEDLRRILVHPLQMIATDGILLGKPHPRAYGTYPRVLGHYVRDQRLLSLEDAIRKMTSLPAQRLRASDRGVLREGAAADVVIFDPRTICDRATFQHPHQFPEGIEYVIVNGVLTAVHGGHQGSREGRVVTPQAVTSPCLARSHTK